MPDTPELLPCPFCGGETDIRYNWAATVSAFCKKCGASTGYYATEALAITAWNRRADGWIPVSERLPEEGVPVMVYSELFGVSPRVCVVTGKKWLFYKAFSSRILKEDSVSSALITHWMPLPAKGEE